MRIKSVVVSDDRMKPLQITFELAATGKKPVAILQSNFHVHLTGGSVPPHTGFGFSFPEGTPQIIVVLPGKPVAFGLSVPVDTVGRLSSGEYALRLQIGEIKGWEAQRYDYEWEGEEYSLQDSPDWCMAIELTEVPHYTTLTDTTLVYHVINRGNNRQSNSTRGHSALAEQSGGLFNTRSSLASRH